MMSTRTGSPMTTLTRAELVDVLIALDVLADQYEDRADWGLEDSQHWTDHAARVRDLHERLISAETVTLSEAAR